MWFEPAIRVQLTAYFRSLDAALDEHKDKKTQSGDAVYERVHEQLAEDLAGLGIGRDQIPAAANEMGHLSTYRRLKALMPKQLSPEEAEAVRLLTTAQEQVPVIRTLNRDSPEFEFWKDNVALLFQTYLPPDSPHAARFRNLRFRGPIQLGTDFPTGGRRAFSIQHGGFAPSTEDDEKFRKDCDTAAFCIKGAIETIQTFGIHRSRPAQPHRISGGIHYHGDVKVGNQAIATDRATQNIEHLGNAGFSLDEIVAVLSQSDELTGRELKDAATAARAIGTEIEKKPNERGWKSVVEWGSRLLDLTNKANDVAAKLAPHLTWLVNLIQEATKHI